MKFNRVWLFVIFGGIVEAVWPAVMNVSGGMSDIAVTVLAFLFSAIATVLLYMGLHRGLPVGPSYAVWVGIGVAGITAIDVAVFGRIFSSWAYLCLFMIIVGVIGLNLTSDSEKQRYSAPSYSKPLFRWTAIAIIIYMSNKYQEH